MKGLTDEKGCIEDYGTICYRDVKNILTLHSLKNYLGVLEKGECDDPSCLTYVSLRVPFGERSNWFYGFHVTI